MQWSDFIRSRTKLIQLQFLQWINGTGIRRSIQCVFWYIEKPNVEWWKRWNLWFLNFKLKIWENRKSFGMLISTCRNFQQVDISMPSICHINPITVIHMGHINSIPQNVSFPKQNVWQAILAHHFFGAAPIDLCNRVTPATKIPFAHFNSLHWRFSCLKPGKYYNWLLFWTKSEN